MRCSLLVVSAGPLHGSNSVYNHKHGHCSPLHQLLLGKSASCRLPLQIEYCYDAPCCARKKIAAKSAGLRGGIGSCTAFCCAGPCWAILQTSKGTNWRYKDVHADLASPLNLEGMGSERL